MRVSLLLSLALILLWSPAGIAAPPSAAQTLYDQGNQALQSSDYPTAIKAYQDILAQYPSETFINEVWFYLGLAQLSNDQPSQALDSFKKLFDPKVPADLRGQAVFYAGQACYNQAEKLAEKSLQRKVAFQDAVRYFTQYLTDFPKDSLREQALFSRVQANFYQFDYDAMQKDLVTLLQDYPTSNNHLDYLYWSGHGYATQALGLLDNDPAKAATIGHQALGFFEQIQKTQGAVLVANDVASEKAAVELSLATTDADYQKVITDLRQIHPREELIPLAQAHLDDLSKQIGQAAQTQNKALYQSLLEQRQRGLRRLNELKVGPDPAVDAYLQIAQAQIYLKHYDEGRVALSYVKPFVTTDEEKERLSYLTILTYAMQGLTDQADANLKQHLIDFAKDPNTQNLRYLLASELQNNQKYAAAEIQYRKSLDDYPNGHFADQATIGLAQVLLKEDKAAEAAELLDAFLKKKPTGPHSAEAHYTYGTALNALHKTDPALTQFHTLALDPSAGPYQINGWLQEGYTQLTAGQSDAAYLTLQALADKFPGTEQASTALFYSGLAQESKKDYTGALSTFQEVLKTYPKQEVAPMAAARIVLLDEQLGKVDAMIAAANQVMTLFPNSPQASEVAFTLAQYFEQARDYDKAAAQYQLIADKQPPQAGAPLAQARIALMWMTAAKAIGNYSALSADEQKQWQADIAKGEKAVDLSLLKFPTARETGVAIEELVQALVLKIDSGILTLDQATAALTDKINQSTQPAVAKQRLDLARIGLIHLKGAPGQSLPLYKQAIAANPTPILNPEDLERYGNDLLANKEYAPAILVFTQLQKSFPKEPRAQAGATYGLGAAYLGQGQTALADPYFTTLEKQYSWSDKLWEAELGRGKAAEDRSDMTTARAFYQKVILANGSTPDQKARGLFGFAHSLEKEGKLVENPAAKDEPNAANNYLKVDALFDSSPDIAAEALWRAGQIFEKAGQTANAHDAYQDLVTKYKTSPFAAQAKDRLDHLQTQGG